MAKEKDPEAQAPVPAPEPIKETKPREPIAEPPKMVGIAGYLGNHPMDSRLAAMFKDIYRGQIATESQWAERIASVLKRTV